MYFSRLMFKEIDFPDLNQAVCEVKNEMNKQ